jgi:hypothetical protein
MTRMTGVFTVGGGESFTPPELLDPHAQMRLKAVLEQIDYAAFAANREIISHAFPDIDQHAILRFATTAAEARARYIKRALVLVEAGKNLGAEEVEELSQLRTTYEELVAAFDAMRRLVERGYTHLHHK